jgi:RHS repeat-associated protein
VSQQRYLPFGQVRTDIGTISQTDLGYTGQRNIDAQNTLYTLGLMDYKARFYSSYITHFNQPDSIVPDPYNPQSFNRYAYALNNPLKYTDPSGHLPCLDDYYWNGQCHSEMDYVKKSLKEDYQWNLDGTWADDELKMIIQTAYDIQLYVDNLTGGRGLDWMNAYLSGVTFSHSKDGPFYSVFGDRGMTLGNHIYLPPGLPQGGYGNPNEYVAHELAHIWDTKTSKHGYVGGVGDNLNDFLGGVNLPFFRWTNVKQAFGWTDPRVPQSYLFGDTVNGGYGVGGPADYLAETFGWSIYGPANIPGYNVNGQPGPGNMWIDAIISLEVEALP